jgi:hypothetical protein
LGAKASAKRVRIDVLKGWGAVFLPHGVGVGEEELLIAKIRILVDFQLLNSKYIFIINSCKITHGMHRL